MKAESALPGGISVFFVFVSFPFQFGEVPFPHPDIQRGDFNEFVGRDVFERFLQTEIPWRGYFHRAVR